MTRKQARKRRKIDKDSSSEVEESQCSVVSEEPDGSDPPLDWFLYIIGDHADKKYIPVTPRFQVEVPEWDGSVDISVLIATYISDSNNRKWLGTRVWPIEKRNVQRIASSAIGKGRSNSCSCQSPGSATCVKHHIEEETQRLKSDLGPAFCSWKLDEAGEQVSKSWQTRAQWKLEALIKNSALESKDWFKEACKFFNGRFGKEIVRFYFDVYIPRRMAERTRSSKAQINTDDEDEAPDSDLNMRERSGWRSLTIRDPKTR